MPSLQEPGVEVAVESRRWGDINICDQDSEIQKWITTWKMLDEVKDNQATHFQEDNDEWSFLGIADSHIYPFKNEAQVFVAAKAQRPNPNPNPNLT